jgi:phenylglyoxylate dehydrogenase epsilon subunit
MGRQPVTNTTHLIIGAGPAALAAAQAIRMRDKAVDITLVSREQVAPYSPAALPYLINGELTSDYLFVKGETALKELKVNVLRGKEVTEVAHATHEVRCKDGEKLSFAKLLVATGASPQMPSFGIAPSERLHTFRTVADFERLAKTLVGRRHIAIYGAGLVAIEVAEKLCLAGHQVTLIARSTLLRKYFRPENVAVVERGFVAAGARVIKGCTLDKVEPGERQVTLVLSNGERLVADELVVATGVTPNDVEKLSCVKVGDSLKVGRTMETSLADVYAAGDVAAGPSFFDDTHESCPILPEAIAQGRIAGANMVGEKLEYGGWISCNTLRFFDDSLFSIGIVVGGSDPAYETAAVSQNNSSLRLTFKGDCLVGVEALNMNHIHPGIFLTLIREKVPVRKHKELLLTKHRETAYFLMSQHRRSQAG